MGSKQLKISDSILTDRISVLPSNIIGCILGRMPIRDAIATSILSKEWRYKWRRIPNLVFDYQFMKLPFNRYGGNEYNNIIGKILLLHLGPIHKFVFHIPPSTLPDINSWMLFISENKVKELTIVGHFSRRISLPSCLFHCNELQHLKLDFLRFYLQPPPQDFRGFCNLLTLNLSGFPDGDEISSLVSKCPILERLSINCKACEGPLVIDAPRLLFLHAYVHMNSFIKLSGVHSLTALSLEFGEPYSIYSCDLFDIFALVPKVETVTLQIRQLIMDVPQDHSTSLPITLHNLKSITLLEIAMSSPEWIYLVICILRSSPNLQRLNVAIYTPANSEEEAALDFLEVQTREPPLIMNSLSTVKIKGIVGSKVEIMLIKLILSCSPDLENMYLTGVYSLKEGEFTLMSELLQCPRSSFRARVIYSRYPGVRSVFDF